MATINWLSRALARVQIATITIAGTYAANDVVNIIINGKTATFTATGAGNPAVATGLQLAAAAMTATEFTRITWTVNSNVITATGTIVGVNHTITTSKTSASGTISSPSVTQTASGPNDWNATANWDTGAVPVNGDTVNIDLTRGSILTGLDQSAVTLAQLRVFSSSQTQNVIGLAELNSDGYTEYRDKFLKIGGTLIEIDCESPRLNIDLGSVASTVTIIACGTTGTGNVPPMRLRGSSASNAIVHNSGYLGLAYFDDETFTCATVETYGPTAKLVTGQGFTATGLTLNSGQSKIVRGAITNINLEGGILDLTNFTGDSLSIIRGAAVTINGTSSGYTLNLERSRLNVNGQTTPSATTLGNGATIADPFGLFVASGGVTLAAGTISVSA